MLDSNFERRLDNKFHDAHEGEITSVIINKDENMFLSSAKDGLIYIFKFDKKCSFNEIKKDHLARLSTKRKKVLASIINAKPVTKNPLSSNRQLKFVKNWQMKDLTPLLGSGLEGNRDFKNGREMFWRGRS